MKTRKRPGFIRHWYAVEAANGFRPPGFDDELALHASLALATGMTRLRTDHVRLGPGARSNAPLAARDVEEFVFVLEGAPDLWVDGYLHRLQEGDGVSFNDGTGIAHAFLNNTQKDVRLFHLGEGSRYGSKFFHPLAGDRGVNEALKSVDKLWEDAPKHKLGPHDGVTDVQRGTASPASSRKSRKPGFVVHWKDIIGEDKDNTYPGSAERHTIDAPFGKHARLSRLGVHFQILKPGRRTSWPHAERDEEEFVFVVSGNVEAWVDGNIHAMEAGDIIGFPAKTGITHAILNNSGGDAHLIVGSEASRVRNQYWYPYHLQYNKEIGAAYWADHPVPKLGPHDGMPDALRMQSSSKKTRSTTKKPRKRG
jgi:uncharacterized cupin superfamily protein